MLIVPESITILGCVTFRASPNKIILDFVVLRENKAFLQLCKQVYDFFLSLIFASSCSIDSIFVSSSTPTDIKSHYGLLCQNSLDLVFILFILTLGELHCWLNSSLSWVELFAEHNKKGAGLVMPLVYLKVRIVFVLTILTTYLPFWPAALRGIYEEEANDSD